MQSICMRKSEVLGFTSESLSESNLFERSDEVGKETPKGLALKLHSCFAALHDLV